MGQRQDIRQVTTQKLIVTPQLRQAIEILQLGSLELADYLEQQLVQNPVLELVDEAADFGGDRLDATDDGKLGDRNVEAVDGGPDDNSGWQLDEWLDYFADSSDLGLPPLAPEGSRSSTVETLAGPSGTLAEHLLLQLALRDIAPSVRQAAQAVIEALDDDGYLRVELEALSGKSACAKAAVATEALAVVQELEPAGVAARDLRECLLLQLRRVRPPSDLACRLVRDHLDDIAAARLAHMSEVSDAGREEIAAAVELVRSLDPRPGAAYAFACVARYVIPDVVIEHVASEYLVTLHDTVVPQLRVSPYYRKLATTAVRSGDEEGTAAFLGRRLRAAIWLLHCVEQRRATLYRVVEVISRRQRDFLARGIQHLRPMTLKDVAVELGVHESTVSRAVANKYVQTPQGAFELKFFFTSGLCSTSGSGQVSSASVKSVLGQLVRAEDPREPHSDQRLVELLRRRGATLSRRTVTKYRHELGIPSAAQRRRI